MTSPRPWNRQSGESAQAYEAFAFYRDLKGASVRVVAELLGKQESLLFRWSSRDNWVARTDAWRAFLKYEPGWHEPLHSDARAKYGSTDLETARSASLTATKELERRMREDALFVQQLSARDLLRIANLANKANSKTTREADRSAPSWRWDDAEVPEEASQWRHEYLRNHTFLHLDADPFEAELRSVYSCIYAENEADGDASYERILEWCSLEKAGRGLGSRELGVVVVVGPPEDWAARMRTLEQTGTLDLMKQSALEKAVARV